MRRCERAQRDAPVAQWIEYWPPKPGVARSIRAGRASIPSVPQYTTTERIDSPRSISANPSLICCSVSVCVISGSIWILPSMYQSTIFGTSLRPRAPPTAEPFQTRPVTSWNGRVAISYPAAATPMITLTPQPLWQHSSA